LWGTPFDYLDDEGPPSGAEPNASPPLEPNMSTNTLNHNDDEVKLRIQMGKAFRNAWGACDVVRNESMNQTNNEDVDQPFSMANHMEQNIGMDATKVDIGA
jgi:hypothetical protein